MILLAFLFLQTSFAQTIDQGLELQLFQAYSLNSMPLWKDALNKLQQQKDSSPEHQLAIAKIAYGMAGAYMGKNEKDKVGEMLDVAGVIADELFDQETVKAEAYAVKSAVMGLRIALSPMKGMILGGKSQSYIQKAVKLDPASPFNHMLMGNYLFYTPEMFGGDLKKAVRHLEKAKSFYEAKANKMTWEYLNTLALLGQAYHKTEQLEQAKSTYETALAASPNFGWVKFALQPALEKDMK